MKHNLIKISSILLALVITLTSFPIQNFAKSEVLDILFTHDIHSYFYPTTTIVDGKTIEHGGAARLATIIKEHSSDNSIYIDGGDFSMGTLFQAAYSSDAYELRILGIAGCDVTTFGNHEFDYGANGAALMLQAATISGDKLPQIVQSNIDLTGELTDEQSAFKTACEDYGIQENCIIERAGYKIGFFGIEGYNSIDCIQTEFNYIDYKEAAKSQVEKLKNEGCDIIVALSHAGIEGEVTESEDYKLAKEVPGIDVILSAHSHAAFEDPIVVGNTTIVACGTRLYNVGKLSVVKEDDVVKVTGYELIPVDSSVDEDEEMLARTTEYKERISDSYLTGEDTFDRVVAHSGFDFISTDEMSNTHQEYNIGNIIADSYMYSAEQNGVDVDVAFVARGTIRNSIQEGDITVADAFEICSLGVGSDGSAGHPIVIAYLSGEEIKLLTELDASLGEMVSDIKMSYSGLSYTFNTEKILLDRVTDIALVGKGGEKNSIDDEKLYKVAVNMYAINMIGMVNSLTKGILTIEPKDADGNPITDFYSFALCDANGNEVKEWVAFKDYLGSFEVGDNDVPEIPAEYAYEQNRKVKISDGSFSAVISSGVATNIVRKALVAILLLVVVLIVIIVLIVRKVKKRKLKKKEG